MRIVGKYLKNNEFHDCYVVIKYGKIQELAFDIKNPFLLLDLHDKYNSSFTIEKHYDVKNSPYNSNYYLKVYGDPKPHLIYLKLSYIKIFCLKWDAKKYLIQSDDMKKDTLKYIIGGIFGLIFGLTLQYIKNAINPPVNPPATAIQKSLEHK